MKKIILLTCITLLSLVFFNSCKRYTHLGSKDKSKENQKELRSSTFSTVYTAYGISGMTYYNGLLYLGNLHNDYQEYILTSLVENEVLISVDTILVPEVKLRTISFFNNIGFNINTIIFDSTYSFNSTNFNLISSNYSTEGYSILSVLFNILSDTLIYNESVISQIDSLIERSTHLANEEEVLKVGVPVSIAKSSMIYWHNNLDRWENAFNYIVEKPLFKAKVGYGQLVSADVGGAISGAYAGAAAGPGGALAGAVLVSSSSSLFNLASQVMSRLIDWW